jgi:5'-3' exonuclease
VNKAFKGIIDKLKESKQEELLRNDRVLIVDSLNTFLRAFVVIHHLNPAGNHIGGLTGFLKSLGYAIELINPTRVILVFDGVGGATNKRYLYPEYKANRHITKITNWDAFDTQEEESEAIKSQIVRLVQYLKCLPVDIIMEDKIEADDVIGYIAKVLKGEVFIMSTDKDYIQLVNDSITVYSPVKKKFYNPKVVQEEFGIPSINYLTQKILLGDSGDNVPGLKGLGEKTMIKLFPMLKEQRHVRLIEILDHCRKNLDTGTMYKKIADYAHQLEINQKLMDLHDPNIPENSIQVIKETLVTPKETMDRKMFLKLYEEDNLQNSIANTEIWLFNKFEKLKHFKVVK